MSPDLLDTCTTTLSPHLPPDGMIVLRHFEDTDEDPSWGEAHAVASNLSVQRLRLGGEFLGKDWAQHDPALRPDWRVFCTRAWTLWLQDTYHHQPLVWSAQPHDPAPFAMIAHEYQPTLPTPMLDPDRQLLPELLRKLPRDWRYQATPASRHAALDHLRFQMSLPSPLQSVYHRLITLHDALDFLQMIPLGPHRLLIGRRRDFAATLVACA